MPSAGSRDGQVTPNDHGPMVNISAWFLIVTMILAVIVRVMIRTILMRSPGVEDGMIGVALVC